MKRNHSTLLFLLILLAVAKFYNYDEIIFKRPQSVHKWRQSDCASMALNYYQNGMDFFSPETHNLTSDNGTSGKCCPSEIPILYYTVAILYKVFGYHDSVFRIFNTLLFFLGLFYLFRIFYYFLEDIFWAIGLTILFFSSPVLVFYGSNYLSNSSSLAFSIIGWYYFFRFTVEYKSKWLYTSMVVFCVAAAFKLTALFSLFAITGMYMLELIGRTKFGNDLKLFHAPIRFAFSIISVFIVIGSWLLYAWKFNRTHDCTYFSTTIFPIWDLTLPGIKGVISDIERVWLKQYFHKSVLLLLLTMFAFFIGNFKKNRKILRYGILIILCEIIVYIIMQFSTFEDHDYYTINMYILPILLTISVFDILKRYFGRMVQSKWLKMLFAVFLLFNVHYTHEKMHLRYHGWMNDYDENIDIYNITPYLRQLGITHKDTVISIPDASHVSLYLMNQKGWTEFTDSKFSREYNVRYNQDSVGIQNSIVKGAKYLVVNGITEIYEKPFLERYCTNLKGAFNNVLIFDLKDSSRNFGITKYRCNAEVRTSDGVYFISTADSSLFKHGKNQSSVFAHSGKYSSKLTVDTPYGMTMKFSKLKSGERFVVSVWRKRSNQLGAGLVISSPTTEYYNNSFKVIEKDENGWEKIMMQFLVVPELVNQDVVIHAYNPNVEPVYFDDLEIIRFGSS